MVRLIVLEGNNCYYGRICELMMNGGGSGSWVMDGAISALGNIQFGLLSRACCLTGCSGFIFFASLLPKLAYRVKQICFK